MPPRGVMDAATRRRLAQNLDPTTAREIMAAVTPRAAIEALVRDGEGREAAGEDASAPAAPAAALAVAVAPRAAPTTAASAVQPAVRLTSATTEQEAKGDTEMRDLTEATAALETRESSDVPGSPAPRASTPPTKDTPVKQHLDEDGEMHSKRGAKTASPSPYGGREIDEDVNLPDNNDGAVEALGGDEPPEPPELVRSKKKGRGEAFGDLDLAQSLLSVADVSQDELRAAALEAIARADEKKYGMISPTSYLRVPIEGRRPIDDVRRILPQLSETDLRTIAGDMNARANAKAAAAGEA